VKAALSSQRSSRGTGSPRACMDISETIDAKMRAITAHASQFGGRGLDTEMYREFAHVQGRIAGVPYAEGLDVLRMLLA